MTEEISETVPEEQIEEIKEVEEEVKEVKEESIKRGRGRPKGALGKKNITRHSEQEQEKRNVEDFILEYDEPKPSRKRVKTIKEDQPEEAPLQGERVEEQPKPKRKVAMKKTPPEETMTYLEVLTRGLRAAESQHKAQRVAKYDTFFRY